MLEPLETLKTQLSNREQQLMYHLIVEQQETNRLLREQNESKQEVPIMKRRAAK